MANNNFPQSRPLPPAVPGNNMQPRPANFGVQPQANRMQPPVPLGPRPPMAPMNGPLGPRPPMAPGNVPLPPPVPGGFNRNAPQRPFGPQQGFGPKANNPFAMNNNFNQQSTNQVASYGPYLNNYDFNETIDYSDSQYIKDLNTLAQFYEQNRYSPILEKRYYDYELGWNPPKITIPINDLYERLKYYDDLLSYEQLSCDQVIEVKQQVKQIIDQIMSYDDFEFYKKYGYERLYYNNNYDQDLNDNAFRNVKYYQRENDLETWGDDTNYVPVSLPKNKWWMSQPFCFHDDESYFVKFINSGRYPNELLLHPMFTYLNQYGSFQDLEQSPIIEQFPEAKNIITEPVKPANLSSSNTQKKEPVKKKRNWFDRMFGINKPKNEKKEQANMANNNQHPEHSKFPKKENPTPPQPTKMPVRQNPTPPQPTIMPPKSKTPPPPPPGKGFGPSSYNQPVNQSYFNYQQNR